MHLALFSLLTGFIFLTTTQPSTAADKFEHWWIIPVGLGVLFVVVVIIVARCSLKQKIRVFIRKCRDRRRRILQGHDDVGKNVADENRSDSGISTDGQSMDTVVELENVQGSNEVDRNTIDDNSTQPLLHCNTGSQQTAYVTQETKQEGNALTIGQKPGTSFFSIQP
jgi:hypothetical protein